MQITGQYIVTDEQSKIDNKVMLYDAEFVIPDVTKKNAYMFMDACVYYNNIDLADKILERYAENIYWFKTFRKIFKVGTIEMLRMVTKHADIVKIRHASRDDLTYNIVFSHIFRVDAEEKINLIIEKTLEEKNNILEVIHVLLRNGHAEFYEGIISKIVSKITDDNLSGIVMNTQYVDSLKTIYNVMPDNAFKIIKHILMTDMRNDLRTYILSALGVNEYHYTKLLKLFCTNHLHYLPILISIHEHYGLGTNEKIKARVFNCIISFIRMGRAVLIKKLYDVETMRFSIDWKYIVYLVNIYKKADEYDFMKDTIDDYPEIIAVANMDRRFIWESAVPQTPSVC